MFDHEMTREIPRGSEYIRDFLAAAETLESHPRTRPQPFLTTVSRLASYSGFAEDLRAFCCAEHQVPVDDVLHSLVNHVVSRVSYPVRK